MKKAVAYLLPFISPPTPKGGAEAEKRWMMEHYWRNKEVLKEKALARYYKNKDEKGRDI